MKRAKSLSVLFILALSCLFLIPGSSLGAESAHSSEIDKTAPDMVVMVAPYKRITRDDNKDSNPRIDDGQIVWLRETEDPGERAIMFYDSDGTRDIATVQSTNVYLEIENGWVFWEAVDSDDFDREKWVYNVADDRVTQISDDATYDNYRHRFEKGKVLWEVGQAFGAKDLVFFDESQTITLAEKGDYRNFSFSGGCVVWEGGDGGPNFRDYDIMFYDGSVTLNLSEMGVANGFSSHVLEDSLTQDGTFLGPSENAGSRVEGHRVVWMARHDYDDDWEILFYDGGTVRQLTNNGEWDFNPQVWANQVAWVRASNLDELWFYKDEESLLLTDDFSSTEHIFVLRDNKVVWHRVVDGPLWVFHTDSETFEMLQDSAAADGYQTLWGPVFDDKGVSWYTSKYNPVSGETDYSLRVYDNSQTKHLDTLHGAIVGPYYQGGYVAWSNTRENTITCQEWQSSPPPGHFEEVERTRQDWEVFLYQPSGETLQLSDDTKLNCVGVTDIDKGQVVWCGEAPPPLPECQSCFVASCLDIFLGGQAVDDLSIYAGDIVLPQVLINGESITVAATIHNEGEYPVYDIKAALVIDSKEHATKSIVSIDRGHTAQVNFQWDVTWAIKDKVRRPTQISVKADPDNDIYEINDANNTATISISNLQKGKKWEGIADGRGIRISTPVEVTFATPFAIWFDDDATLSEKGIPTRHYNPIATSQDVLNDIDFDFKDDQFPNAVKTLEMADFSTDLIKLAVPSTWSSTAGLVLVATSTHSRLAGAPVASYLNWPMLSSELISTFKEDLEYLIKTQGVSYILAFADNQSNAEQMSTKLKDLNLPPEKHVFVKTFIIEPLDNNEPAKAFAETLRAFGDKPSSIVIINSRDNSCLAAAPLAAFYKSLILDVREVVNIGVGYVADNYDGLQNINTRVSNIIDKGGGHDIKGFIQEFMAPGPVTVFLVGNVTWLPFGIEHEPAAFKSDDADKNWIASDYRYYHAHPAIVPGGRIPLADADNVNYVAMALQFDELPAGDRDVGDGWEDNVLGAAIFNSSGLRQWEKQRQWWLDSVIYQLEDLSKKAPNIEVTRLFENPWVHQGGWGANWYRFDTQWAKWFKMKGKDDEVIQKAPIIYDYRNPQENPIGLGRRGDGVNNDNDMIGYEDNDGRHPVELIWDADSDGKYDPAFDVIVHEGLTPGIQATTFVELIDEEVWDGFDNDGDGAIDEDCNLWHLVKLEEVYNESMDSTAPDLEPGDYIDLIDTELLNYLFSQGLIIYSGHGWTDSWSMRNVGGNYDPGDPNGPTPPNFDPPPKTTDDRTDDQTDLKYNEVPDMTPSFVYAGACGTARMFEANDIARVFLKKGALAYVGCTVLAYDGSESDLRQQVLDQISKKLEIGKAFRLAVDNLGKNRLWALLQGEGNIHAEKTRYGFNLLGLGSTRIDLRQGVVKKTTHGATTPDSDAVAWSAGTPVYDSEAMTWSVDVIFDVPAPIEVEDGEGNVVEFLLTPDLMTYLSDAGDYPAIRSLPFDYNLPVGGRFVDLSSVSSTVHHVYDFSLYKVTDKPMWPPDEDEREGTYLQSEEPELYEGPLYPNVLFVSDFEYDSLTNSDRIHGSVTAFQVDGTVPQTTVYDTIVLRLTYTAPLGLEETHVVDEADLTVQAAMVSTDGEEHVVTPKLTIETVGGLIHKEVIKEELTVGLAEEMVDFEVNDIELYDYVGRITLSENAALAAEITFEVTAPDVELDPCLEAAIREAISKPSGPIFAFDLEVLTSLDASGRGIADLSGIENCVNLTELNLNSNRITDISLLSDLTSLTQLHLHKNQIADIEPLVKNSGLGQGDSIDLRDNPLDAMSKDTYIPQLAANGVSVQFEIMLGDLNDDTSVDLTDAILASQIMSGAQPEQTVFTSCEVSGDDKIAGEEMNFILQSACGLR